MMARPCLFQHRKFKRLVGVLALPRPQVVGLLEMLWHVAYEDGQENVGDELSVEHAAEWWGDRGKLVKALEDCGFLDRQPNGTYSIHDLFEHAPDYVRKRKLRSDERRARAKKRRTTADNGGQCPPMADADRTTADNGGKRQKTAPNGRTPAPAPAPAPIEEYLPPDKPADKGKRKDRVIPKPREPNLVWDAVVEVTRADVSLRGTAKRVGAVVSDLSIAQPPYTAADVQAFPAAYAKAFPGCVLTIEALGKHIAIVRNGVNGGGPRSNGRAPSKHSEGAALLDAVARERLEDIDL